MKMGFAAVVLISMILMSSMLVNIAAAYSSAPASAPSPSGGYCDQKCGERCKEKGRESRCMKYCMMCCGKCNCVPSGTSGNKDQCPCYRDWKSPNGRPKCP